MNQFECVRCGKGENECRCKRAQPQAPAPSLDARRAAPSSPSDALRDSLLFVQGCVVRAAHGLAMALKGEGIDGADLKDTATGVATGLMEVDARITAALVCAVRIAPLPARAHRSSANRGSGMTPERKHLITVGLALRDLQEAVKELGWTCSDAGEGGAHYNAAGSFSDENCPLCMDVEDLEAAPEEKGK
jgi:hypothetical protein